MITPTTKLASSPLPKISIALISTTALAYEVLLMRLFSIVQWHHFAYMLISIALLGYGASGVLLAIIGDRIKAHLGTAFVSSIICFALTSSLCYWLAQSLPFNPLELLWDPQQALWLFAMYLVLALPFLFAATALGIGLITFRTQITKLYAADLLGAGIGSIIVIVLLSLFLPQHALALLSSLGLVTAAVACWELRVHLRWRLPLILSAVVIVVPTETVTLAISPYKSLPQILHIQDSKLLSQESGPLGLVSVVESNTVPLRYAPGLSLQASVEPPPQLGIFVDGDGPSVINRFTGDFASLSYLAQMTTALPYALLSTPDVLVLGAGGGTDVLQALYFSASHVDAVELNPHIIELMANQFRAYNGDLFRQPQVELHRAEARSFVRESQRQYDLIQIALLDSFNSATTGTAALSENYLYTTEAIADYLRHLRPHGLLAVTRWLQLPPRDVLKLVATTIDALESLGVDQPEKHFILLRSWNTATLLVSASELTPQQIDTTKVFSKQWSFDLDYFPSMSRDQANIYNILDQTYFFDGVHALLSPSRDTFIAQYKFNIAPATDNQPYFFHFLNWQTVQELLSLPARQGLPLLEWGSIVVVMTLVQAIVASAVLVLLPLFIFQQKTSQGKPPKPAPILIYFFSLGIAFMFIEMAFLQKFSLFLYHPLYATATVLCSFLVFAGLGSASVKRLPDQRVLIYALSGITILTLLYILCLPYLFSALATLEYFEKILAAVFIIAPLAFFMGMPFSYALTRVGEQSPALIPWAWATNGCASVISTSLATLLAMQWGFDFVLIGAIVFYLLAGWSFSRWKYPAISR